MAQVAEATVSWMGRHLSRRGFLALCGKLAIGVGAAMAGVKLTERAAAAGGCCPAPNCEPTFGHCQPSGSTHLCPTGCSQIGPPSVCCDTGGTNTLHTCIPCLCNGTTYCSCEYDNGTPCM